LNEEFLALIQASIETKGLGGAHSALFSPGLNSSYDKFRTSQYKERSADWWNMEKRGFGRFQTEAPFCWN
jgi:hypothetical protein